MQLARAVHLDDSDLQVYANPARTGEWCISGGFEFSNWVEADLTGKPRQAFANGWLGLETSGRVTLVAITKIEASEYQSLVDLLAQHFVDHYGAPDLYQARPVAREELNQMLDICADHAPNTLLTVSRELGEAGVHESYRQVNAAKADLAQFALHAAP